MQRHSQNQPFRRLPLDSRFRGNDEKNEAIGMTQFISGQPLRGGHSPRLEGRIAALAALLLLAGCHGGTLDAVYPGELGHTPPPAVNLPPQDQGMEQQ